VSVDSNRTAYVVCNGDTDTDGKVISISLPYGNITVLTNYSNCPTPKSVAVNNEGSVYVACSGYGTNNSRIIKIDNRIITTLADQSQCKTPFVARIDEKNSAIYASCYSSSSIVRIHEGVISTLVNASECYRMSYNIDVNTNSDTVYTVCASRGVGGRNYAISVSKNVVREMGSVCSKLQNLFVDENTGDMYFYCDNSANAVIRVDSKWMSVTTLFTSSQCSYLENILVDARTNAVYAACTNGIIGARNGMIVFLITPAQCQTPTDIFIDKNKGVMYAACGDYGGSSGKVIRIDLPSVFSHPNDGGLSTESIIGIAIGSVAGLALLFLVICCVVRRSRNTDLERLKLIGS
jgi:DNA-binding beta-propeller fold protein YncE